MNPEGMGNESLLLRSGQARLLTIGLWWLPLLGFLLVCTVLAGVLGRTPDQKGVLVLLGLGLMVASYVWIVLRTRCPSCGARLLWKAMRERSPDEWLSWVASLEACPVCQSDGTGKM